MNILERLNLAFLRIQFNGLKVCSTSSREFRRASKSLRLRLSVCRNLQLISESFGCLSRWPPCIQINCNIKRSLILLLSNNYLPLSFKPGPGSQPNYQRARQSLNADRILFTEYIRYIANKVGEGEPYDSPSMIHTTFYSIIIPHNTVILSLESRPIDCFERTLWNAVECQGLCKRTMTL